MAEWGRKEYSKAWPSRTPVWTWTAIFLSFLFLAGMLTLEVLAELDSGGAAVPVGLPVERSARLTRLIRLALPIAAIVD